MGTRGFIARVNEDAVIEYVYCGHDSYPSHLGGLLLTNYNTADKVKALLDFGDMSSVESTLDKCLTYADTPNEDVAPKVVLTQTDLSDAARYIDYVYLFKDDKWFISRWDYGEYVELTQKMVDED